MHVTSADMKKILCWAVASSALVLAERTLAQESEGGLQEVVITAEKREASLQDTTIAITAIQADQIASYGIRNPNDIQSQMPAVQFMTSGLTNTMIRGVGTYNNQPNVDAAVAWNIDGTYISHHMATPPILFDIDRIEVVRGPLGTLYGKNSNGGSINVVTARPVLGEWKARASVGTGNHDQVDTEFMVNIPISETMALRASVANDYSEGYYEDGGEGTDNYAARVRLLYEPSERFDLIGTMEWSDVDGSGVGLSYCPPRAPQPACDNIEWKPYQGFGLPGNFIANGTDGPIGENPGFTARENWSAYVEMNYRWDAATLTSITNWHKYDREELHVWDFVSYSPLHVNKFITQEFRVASAPDSKFDWVVGAFYAKEDSDGVERFGTQLAPTYQVFQAVNSYGVENGKVTTAAIFSEVTYPLSDRFRVKGGLRYTDEEKDLPGTARARLNTASPVIVTTGSVLSEGKVTWLVGTEYDWGNDNLLYAKVNTGFKSGTVNAVPEGIGVPTATDPEEVTAYQIGSKNRFLDNRLQLNAELFYYDYSGYQVVVIATDPTGFFPGQFFPSQNAQKAKFKGGEIEANWLVSEAGQLDLALTLLDAKHTQFVTSAFNWSGKDVQRAPPYTVMAAYRHKWSFANGGSLTGRISSMYVDGNYTRDANNPGDWQEGYTNTSANLTYHHPNGKWSFSGWVRNLEDEAIIALSRAADRGGYSVFTFPPRMWGVTLKFEM